MKIKDLIIISLGFNIGLGIGIETIWHLVWTALIGVGIVYYGYLCKMEKP